LGGGSLLKGSRKAGTRGGREGPFGGGERDNVILITGVLESYPRQNYQKKEGGKDQKRGGFLILKKALFRDGDVPDDARKKIGKKDEGGKGDKIGPSIQRDEPRKIAHPKGGKGLLEKKLLMLKKERGRALK